MATNTYVALDKVTVASDTPSVTFSSIPQNYTDLRLVVSSRVTGAQNSSGMDVYAYYNSDQSTNYSMTQIYANGSSSSANRAANITYAYFGISSNSSSNDWPTFSVDIMNYSNTTTYKPAIARVESSLQSTSSRAILWKSTAAISSITFYPELSLSFKAGTTFSLYGIAAEVGGSTPKATGGTVTSDATYYYHTFTSSGNFIPNQSLTADYLVVAGGGGGGGYVGGGGGAGGLRSTVTSTGGGGSLETPLSLTAQSYSVLIGAGGSGGTLSTNNAVAGSNSSFATITSTGGGIGAGGGNNPGGNGGSGGGGGYTGAPGTGTANQGFNGGTRVGNDNDAGNGGGGAGSAGSGYTTSPTRAGGAGGNGVYTALSNAVAAGQLSSGNYYLAGGGGGCFANSNGGIGPGGLGGGGNGGYGGGGVGVIYPTAGTANTGGGGGAAGYNSGNSNANGKAGGSGIVIVRYAK